jgi:hypothetical protein
MPTTRMSITPSSNDHFESLSRKGRNVNQNASYVPERSDMKQSSEQTRHQDQLRHLIRLNRRVDQAVQRMRHHPYLTPKAMGLSTLTAKATGLSTVTATATATRSIVCAIHSRRFCKRKKESTSKTIGYPQGLECESARYSRYAWVISYR